MDKKRYNPSTLVFRKGKWYVQVTKPKALQFGSDKQARRSTGTSDRQEARYLQHELTQQIYVSFDEAMKRTDPVFELLRHKLEVDGVNTKQWYDEGYIELEVRGDKTHFAKTFAGVRFRQDDQPINFVERWKASNHVELLSMFSGLGHAINPLIIDFLSQEDRSKVLEIVGKGPHELPTKTVIEIAKALPVELASKLIDYPKKGDALIRLNETENVTNTAILANVLDDYLNSRPHKSRRADKTQLEKWLKHPTFSRLPLSEIEHYDAYDFLEEFDEELTKSSIRVLRAAMSNVFVWAKKRRELQVSINPFRDLDLRSIGKDGIEKRPFSNSELKQLFQLRLPEADRKALEILLTTGMRGGELMQVQKISEDEGIRFIDLRELETKTKGSRRMVPIHDKLDPTVPLKTNQQRLNRIIRDKFQDVRLTLHSLRHTFKDLARDAGVSEEIHKFITGHSAGDVSGNYGVGPSLKARHKAIMSIPFPWID